MGLAARWCTTMRCQRAGHLSRSPTRCCPVRLHSPCCTRLCSQSAERNANIMCERPLRVLGGERPFAAAASRGCHAHHAETALDNLPCSELATLTCLAQLEPPERLQAALGLLRRMVHDGREADGSPTRDRLKLIPRVVNVDEWARNAPLSGTVRALPATNSTRRHVSASGVWAVFLQRCGGHLAASLILSLWAQNRS